MSDSIPVAAPAQSTEAERVRLEFVASADAIVDSMQIIADHIRANDTGAVAQTVAQDFLNIASLIARTKNTTLTFDDRALHEVIGQTFEEFSVVNQDFIDDACDKNYTHARLVIRELRRLALKAAMLLQVLPS